MAGTTEENKNENEQEKKDQTDVGGDKSGQEQKKDSAAGAGSDKSTAKTFTQEEVNALAAREKNQGKNSVLEKLGLKTDADIAKFRAMIDAQKTPEQLEKEKDTEKLELEQRAVRAESKATALMLGAKPDCIDEVIDLAMAKMQKAGGDKGDLKTVVAEIKTKFPSMFTDGKSEDADDKDGKKKAGQRGTGGGFKADASGKEDSKPGGIGARLAAQNKKTTKAGPFWGGKK